MKGAPTVEQTAFASLRMPDLSRNGFTAVLIMISACAASARAVPGVVDTTTAIFRGFLDNKVLWVCLGIAVWHLLQNPSPALRGSHLVAAVPALLLAGWSGGIWPWIGLTVSLSLLMATSPAWGIARTGILIGMVAALHKIGIDILGELSGDTLLAIEAGIAELLAGWMLPALEAEGNALQMPGGHMVVLIWGCSSLSNLGDALLLFWALVSVRVSGPTPQGLRGRFVGCILLLTCITIALNALRLTLMAGDPASFAYIHGSEGGAWFRLATLGTTALLSTTAFAR